MRHLILIGLLIVSSHSVAQTEKLPSFPFLVVSGRSEIHVPPDKVSITFTVLEFNTSAEIAVRTVQETSLKVVALCEKHGIPLDAISSESLEKETQRSRGENYQSLEVLGYQVFQTFNINLDDLTVFPEFSNDILSLNNVVGFNTKFDVQNRESLIETLFTKASSDAKQRANVLASAMSVDLGPVYGISDGTEITDFSAVYQLSTQYRALASASMRDGGSVEEFALFQPKTIELEKSVKVIFKIEPQ